jgi:secreted PhoX family phosphatase
MGTRKGEVLARGTDETLGEVVHRKIARRTLLKGILAFPVVTLAPSFLMSRASHGAEIDQLRYQPIALSLEDEIKVPPGYSADVLLRWGDPILAGESLIALHREGADASARKSTQATKGYTRCARGAVAGRGLSKGARRLALCDKYFSAHIGVDGTEIVVVAGMVEVRAVTRSRHQSI